MVWAPPQSQVSKHAQEGTTLQDHTLLEHSGFGPFCNIVVTSTAEFKGIGSSLLHWVHEQQKPALQWFQHRLASMKMFSKMIDAGNLSAGFCVCCSYTQADMLFNGLSYSRSDGDDGDSSSNLCDVCDMVELFPPRQEPYFFPKVTFTSRGRRELSMVVDAGLQMEFMMQETHRRGGAKMATICVQAAAYANWPDGWRHHTLGSSKFTPSQQNSHDIKRGALIEGPFAGKTMVSRCV